MNPGELQPSPADPLIGKVVSDRYRIIRKLGAGGMGAVYLAEHVFIEKKVALKVLAPEFAGRADLAARFLQEAKSASRIGHENVIDISDFGQSPDGFVYISMEFLEGVDLGETIRRDGALAWGRAKGIVLQIGKALRAAHARGIVHRDLKPENIFLIQREGRPDFVKLLDFGIAKVMGGVGENAPRLTRTGMIFGTPEYMAPEQAEGKDTDHRVDIYAVGCVIYHLTTGDTPFKADSFMGTLTKHLLEDPVPPSARRPDLAIDPALDALILKALEKDRAKRFQGMQELMDVVAKIEAPASASRPAVATQGVSTRALGGADLPAVLLPPARSRARDSVYEPTQNYESIEAKSEEPVPRSGPRTRLVLIAAGLVLGGAAAMWWVLAGRRSPEAAPVHAPAPPAVAPPAPPPEKGAAHVAAPPGAEEPASFAGAPGQRRRSFPGSRVARPRPGDKVRAAARSDEPRPPLASPPPARKAAATPPELKPFPQ